MRRVGTGVRGYRDAHSYVACIAHVWCLAATLLSMFVQEAMRCVGTKLVECGVGSETLLMSEHGVVLASTSHRDPNPALTGAMCLTATYKPGQHVRESRVHGTIRRVGVRKQALQSEADGVGHAERRSASRAVGQHGRGVRALHQRPVRPPSEKLIRENSLPSTPRRSDLAHVFSNMLSVVVDRPRASWTHRGKH